MSSPHPWKLNGLSGQRDLGDVIQGKDLKIERLPWIMWVGPVTPHKPLKAENFLDGVRDAAAETRPRRSQRFQVGEGLGAVGALSQDQRGPLGAQGGSSWQPARKWGPQSYVCKKQFRHQICELGSGFSQRPQ